MGLDEVLLVQVGIDLSGRDVGVTQELLNDSEVGSAFEEVGGEGVAQEVGIDFVGESGLFGSFFDDLSHSVRGERASSDGEKDVGGGFAGFDQFGPLAGEEVLDGDERSLANGHEAGFVPFSGHA